MNHYPSRSEKRYATFYSIAEKGGFDSSQILYSTEVRNLSNKQGFSTKVLRTFESSAVLYDVEVSWKNAFGDVLPYPVEEYVNGNINTFPSAYVKNTAQELCVIAHRAKLQNSI